MFSITNFLLTFLVVFLTGILLILFLSYQLDWWFEKSRDSKLQYLINTFGTVLLAVLINIFLLPKFPVVASILHTPIHSNFTGAKVGCFLIIIIVVYFNLEDLSTIKKKLSSTPNLLRIFCNAAILILILSSLASFLNTTFYQAILIIFLISAFNLLVSLGISNIPNDS